MAKSLIERIRAARQTSVKVGNITLICRRPTDLEMASMKSAKITQEDILLKFVDDWQGMTEGDMVPGGEQTEVPFSKELFAEWIADHPESWGPVSDAVVQTYQTHAAKLEEASKNSKPGSKV